MNFLVWTQTVLSLPPSLPKEVENALKPYFSFTEDQRRQSVDLNSSLCRRLFEFDSSSVISEEDGSVHEQLSAVGSPVFGVTQYFTDKNNLIPFPFHRRQQTRNGISVLPRMQRASSPGTFPPFSTSSMTSPSPRLRRTPSICDFGPRRAKQNKTHKRLMKYHPCLSRGEQCVNLSPDWITVNIWVWTPPLIWPQKMIRTIQIWQVWIIHIFKIYRPRLTNFPKMFLVSILYRVFSFISLSINSSKLKWFII